MDMTTFCRILCLELSQKSLTLPTGVFFGSQEVVLGYRLEADECDVLLGAIPQGKPDLAKRLFLRLFAGIPLSTEANAEPFAAAGQ